MIANERWLIKWSVIIAVCFFCSGFFASIVIAVAEYKYKSTSSSTSESFTVIGEVLKGIPAIAGTGFGIFSIKDFSVRKNKIVILKYISDIFSNSRNKALLEEANELFKGMIKNLVN